MKSGLKIKIKQQFATNKRIYRGRSYTVPSPDTYPYQWFWDSCFNAITLSYFDIDRAKEELELLTKAQFKNGMMPHIIYWQKPKNDNFPKIHWGHKQTSSITQPPMLAIALWRLYEVDQDVEFVQKMLPHIHALHRYLFNQRDPHGFNLAAIINPDESGEDNSPRFDKVLGLKNPRHQFVDNFKARLDMVDDWRESRFVVKNTLIEKDWVYDVSFNSILAESLRLTANLAEAAGNEHIARYSDAKAQLVRLAIAKKLNKNGHYHSAYGKRFKPLNKLTWVQFMPLYAGVASREEAQNLVKNYLNNPQQFATPYSVPTVPLSQPSFDPSGDWRGDWWVGTNWRGPVWMSANWFIIQGLLRYGFHAEANKIYTDSLHLIEQSGLREYYDPLTGEGHGARGFTWGGLVLDMEELVKVQSN